jgi:hypothetical protein
MLLDKQLCSVVILGTAYAYKRLIELNKEDHLAKEETYDNY